MHIVIGAGYLGHAQPRALPRTVDGKRLCSRCQRWRPEYEFESKGQRGGRQVRRGVCEDCRYSRKWVYEALEHETRRTCIHCGHPYAIAYFVVCGHYIGRVYRRWTCRVCLNAEARRRYRVMRWRTARKRVRRYKPYRQRVA